MGKFNAEELSDFARYYGFHYENINPFAMVKEVLIDMERGLKDKASSLPMIPSYITPVNSIPYGKKVLALDAGGTNLRASLVEFDEKGKAQTHGTKKTSMPGTTGHVSADQFFDQIAETALPLLNETKIEGMGFTFSYEVKITPETEGICSAFSKEIDAPDVIGKNLGAGLREAFARKGFIYDGPIVMLNDTTATLLSGFAAIPADGAEPFSPQEPLSGKNAWNFPAGPVIGFILGTGFNTAYPETSIPKIGFESKKSPQIVVCESGAFNIRNLGPLDREFDNTTKNPQFHILEKVTSGAYLGPLTQHILKQAVKDKVISFKKSGEFLTMPQIETRFLNEFCRFPLAGEGPLGSLFDSDDGDALAATQYLTSIVTERAALFSASVLAAAVEKTKAGYEPYSPVRIAVEGTTYMIYKGMRRSLDAWLHILLSKDKPRPYIISPVEQASLFGAAVAAVSK